MGVAEVLSVFGGITAKWLIKKILAHKLGVLSTS